ncbi:tol-pal system protein YbgF [Maricaulis salignorans]|uniref:Cell division coordinator CpoB n=1 Tax=Maricaulis salignorans TaxID=144026 RepID=A0A1G9UQA8_9PROT|nr:tol-pal system protein YbgF [Maricaulis salignorans]SDM62111.1 tol-pal system protein YbgF [Maricaulis salignorans]
MIRSVCLTVLALAMFATAPAPAQSRREMTERIDATEVRIGRLEERFMAGDPVADTLMQRLDALDYQVREMTGEIERLSFENRQLRQQIEQAERQQRAARAAAPTANLPADDAAAAWMQDGIGEAGDADTATGPAIVNPDDPFAPQRAAATGVLGGAPGASALPASDPAVLYEDARGRLLDGDFDGAEAGFERFVAEHGDDPRAGEAWYWLGETFFVRGHHAESADAYIASLRAQPAGERAPDALVRLAASLHGLGQTREACATLARFGGQFPNASAASRDRAARESARAGCQ